MNGRTREGFYALWTMAILICLAVCIGVLAYVSIVRGSQTAQTAPPVQEGGQQPADQAPGAASDGVTSVGVQPEGQDEQGQIALPGEGMPTVNDAGSSAVTAPLTPSVTLLAQTGDMGQNYLDQIVFLGGSTTYGLYSYGLLPHQQVWTPATGTMSLFNWAAETIDYYPAGSDASQPMSIPDCASAAQPAYLVITLGINGISILNEEQFKEYYSSLVQAIQAASPNTRIMCQSIYPVVDDLAPSGINNESVTAANGWIYEIAAQTGTGYLATHDALVNAEGALSEDYLDPGSDGIHFNASGYSAILQYIRTHAWQ